MSASDWHLPKNLLNESIEIMKPPGQIGNEGLALWFGIENSEGNRITHIIEVFGPGFKTTPLHMSLSLKAMAKLTEVAQQYDVYLMGQIHSHPGTFVDLSEVDKQFGIRIPNYLSVVCPYYAQNSQTTLEHCGIHTFELNNYRRLSNKEIENRVHLEDLELTKLKIEVPT